MDLLITATTEHSAKMLKPLLAACERSSCQWGLFLTNSAAVLANEPWMQAVQASSSKISVCQESWQKFKPDQACHLPLGSQTNHSEMIGTAKKLLSL